jgi:hypothetical protein
VLGRPEFKIPCEKLLRSQGAIVYAWMRDGRALYIGMSTSGLLRPLSGSHDVCWRSGRVTFSTSGGRRIVRTPGGLKTSRLTSAAPLITDRLMSDHSARQPMSTTIRCLRRTMSRRNRRPLRI